MRKKLAGIFVAFSLLFSAASCSADEKKPAPTLKQLLSIVMRQQDLVIKNMPFCDSVFVEPTDQTLGNFVADQLANFADNGINTINSNCIQDEQAKSGWHCTLTFSQQNQAEEVGSQYGLDFRLTEKNEIVKDSISCPGAG